MSDTKVSVKQVMEIERKGQVFTVKASTLEAADELMHRQMAYEKEVVTLLETVPAFPWDGSIALNHVMTEKYGVAFVDAIPEMFNKGTAKEISVETGVGETTRVPWGRFPIPGAPAKVDSKDANFLQCGTANLHGLAVFQVQAAVQRKYIPIVQEIVEAVRERVKTCSIYRGKALRIRFRDDDGALLPIPDVRFVDLSRVEPSEVVFSKGLEKAIAKYIYAPLRWPEACRAMKAPIKRGALLAGTFGTGKTLLMSAMAKVAVASGKWTSIYLENAGELPDAVPFAAQYSPCIVAGEDIDRVASGKRTAVMDKLTTALDGIESKHQDVMVVLTTNHIESINEVMLRPGRLDLKLYVDPPDAEAVTRLIRVYGRQMVGAEVDLTSVGAVLAGKNPAVVREVVERAKLAYIERTQGAVGRDVRLTAEDLYETALEKVAEDARSVPVAHDEPVPLTDLYVLPNGKEKVTAAGIAKEVAKRLGS